MACMPTVMALPYICLWKSWKSRGHFENTVNFLQLLYFVIHEKTTKYMAFQIVPESGMSFLYCNLLMPLLDSLHKRKRPNLLVLLSCSWKCSAHAWKTWSRRIFYEVSWRGHCIHKAASWIELQNHGAICWYVLCEKESMAGSADCAPAKPSPAKKRWFQKFMKEYLEKWSFITVDEKGDTCMNSEVRTAVLKWLDWRMFECDKLTAFSTAQNW